MWNAPPRQASFVVHVEAPANATVLSTASAAPTRAGAAPGTRLTEFSRTLAMAPDLLALAAGYMRSRRRVTPEMNVTAYTAPGAHEHVTFSLRVRRSDASEVERERNRRHRSHLCVLGAGAMLACKSRLSSMHQTMESTKGCHSRTGSGARSRRQAGGRSCRAACLVTCAARTQVASQAVTFYTNLTGVQQPLGELDALVVPGKEGSSAGWGLLLFDEKQFLVNEARACALGTHNLL